MYTITGCTQPRGGFLLCNTKDVNSVARACVSVYVCSEGPRCHGAESTDTDPSEGENLKRDHAATQLVMS